MKKTLIAIAALAATGAFAQSTVTIDGNVDAGYVSLNYKGNGVSGVDRNITSTSAINFRANTDLGGGLRAYWHQETDFIPTSTTANTGAVGNVASTTAAGGGAGTTNGVVGTWGAGQAMFGTSGSFGAIDVGGLNNAALGAHNISQPFGTAYGSGFGATSGSFVTAAVRQDNSLRYTSPVFGGGFKFAVLSRKQQAVTGTNSAFSSNVFGTQAQSQGIEWNLDYNAGPLNATLVRATQDATNIATATAGTGAVAIPATAAKGVYTGLAANYNFGAATLYGGYQLNKAAPYAAANTVDRQTVTIAAKYVAGVHTFLGSYQRASNNLATAVGTTSNGQTSSASASNLIGLGYEYALSKTTAFTTRYERIGDSANLLNSSTTGMPFAAVNNSSDRTRIGVGLRMGF